VILLVTSCEDLTTDYLIRRLDDRGLAYFRFNTEEFPSTYEVSLSISKTNVDFSIIDTRRAVELKRSDILGAYFRRPGTPEILDHNIEEDQRFFDVRELEETLRSIWRAIPHNRWLNHPENIWLANNKFKQLTIARDLGFTIPETLISSRPADILKFANTHGNLIVKAVKNGFFNSDRSTNIMFTSSVGATELEAIATSRSLIPSILQPELIKACDLRVTVAGQAVFPVALLSQQYPETSTDWRTWDITEGLHLVHQHFDLPDPIRQLCLDLNQRLGLNFSCIDLVLTTSGDFVFLEVNPNGQWAWIESMVGMPVRDAIIDQLIKCHDLEF
jgi:glutathione synthase/RimK-type ligase-like ATP-grasp enzyme